MLIVLIKSIAIAMPVTFVATVLYVHLLLAIADIVSGALKFILSLFIYLLFAVVIVMPLFYLLTQMQVGPQTKTTDLVMVLVSYLFVVAPGLYYLGKVKIKQLRNAGYFLPRG